MLTFHFIINFALFSVQTNKELIKSSEWTCSPDQVRYLCHFIEYLFDLFRYIELKKFYYISFGTIDRILHLSSHSIRTFVILDVCILHSDLILLCNFIL